jgi:four helix bundle protein
VRQNDAFRSDASTEILGVNPDPPRLVAVSSYRDLKVWQAAMDLVVECYRLAKLLPPSEHFGLARQLVRAAVSIPANIAEGHGRLRRGEYLHHLSIGRGSLKEVETYLALIGRLDFVPAGELVKGAELCSSVTRMLKRLRQSLRR